jgi:Uri superfamily endonuclease
MESDTGTYALILKNSHRAAIRIGRWGRLALEPGFFVYVGSAFGPGGVRARVRRHVRSSRVRHWHIDYLRAVANPLGAWYSHDARCLEHQWAQVLAKMPGFAAVPGIGCSDCRCDSHLFFSRRAPDFVRFSRLAPGRVQAWVL